MPAQVSPFKTKEEHHRALDRINQIVDAIVEPTTDTELQDLVELVKLYENEHFPIGLPDVLSAIKFRMDQAKLSNDDLVSCIGSRQKVKDVLAGKREVTLSMARSLHQNSKFLRRCCWKNLERNSTRCGPN